MNWKFFVGSCILATGLLLKMGAPLLPIVLGIAGVAFLNWKRHQGGPSGPSKKHTGA